MSSERALEEIGIYLEEGAWDKAIEKLRDLRNELPCSAEVHLKLALALAVRGRFESIIATYLHWSEAALEADNLEQAEVAIEQAISLAPECLNARRLRIELAKKRKDTVSELEWTREFARLAMELDQGEESLEVLRAAHDQYPDNLEVAGELAEMCLAHGLIKEGGERYRGCAEAYLEAEELRKGLEAYQRLKVIASDDPELLMKVGTLHLKLEELDLAEQEFRAVLRHDLEHQNALLELGAVCQLKGRFRSALLAFRRVLEKSPEHAHALKKSAEIHLAMGDSDEATEQLLTAARVCLEEGQRDEAAQLYQMVLGIVPEHVAAQQALASLGAPAVERTLLSPTPEPEPEPEPQPEPEPVEELKVIEEPRPQPAEKPKTTRPGLVKKQPKSGGPRIKPQFREHKELRPGLRAKPSTEWQGKKARKPLLPRKPAPAPEIPTAEPITAQDVSFEPAEIESVFLPEEPAFIEDPEPETEPLPTVSALPVSPFGVESEEAVEELFPETEETLVEERFLEPVEDFVIETSEELFKEPVEEFTLEPAEELFREPVEDFTLQPAEELFREPVEDFTLQPAEELFREPVEDFALEPAEELFQEPVEDLTLQPAEELFQEPVEDLTAEPVDSTTLPAVPTASLLPAAPQEEAIESHEELFPESEEEVVVVGEDLFAGFDAVTTGDETELEKTWLDELEKMDELLAQDSQPLVILLESTIPAAETEEVELPEPQLEPQVEVVETVQVEPVLSAGEQMANLRETLRLAPSDQQARVELADLCLRFGMLDEAVRHYRRALQQEPESVEIYDRMVEAELWNDNNQGASDALLDCAELHFQRGDHVQSRNKATTLMALDPHQPAARKLLIAVFEAQQEHALASYHLTQLAEEQLAQGELERSLTTFEKLLDIQPTPQARERVRERYQERAVGHQFQLAQAMLDRGQLGKAIEYCQSLLETQTDHVEARQLLMEIYLDSLQTELAYQQFAVLAESLSEEALGSLTLETVQARPELTPGLLGVLLNSDKLSLLATLRKTLDADLTETFLTTLRNQLSEPDNQLLNRSKFGRLCFQLGDFDSAIEQFQILRRHSDYEALSYRMLGRCFAKKSGPNMLNLALRQFRKGLAACEEQDAILYDMAVVLLENERPEEALEQLRLCRPGFLNRDALIEELESA